MLNIARSVVLTSLLFAGCAFDVDDKPPDPVHCELAGAYCNCTGLVNGSVDDLNTSARLCNALRGDGGL